MKKMFAASLVAIMAVSAANAEIASVAYTNNAIEAKTGNISELTTTAKSNLTAAVNELAGKITATGSGATDAIDAAKTELQGSIDAVDDKADANADAISKLDEIYATDTALTDGLALKQDKSAMVTELTSEVKAAVDSYYPSVGFVQTAIADANNEVGGSIADLTGTVNELSSTVVSNKTAADTGIQEAKDAAAAASTAAGQALTDAKAYTDTEIGKVGDAFAAADGALKTELESQIRAASGSADGVASDLERYQESNDAAVAAAKAQADKGVADAAAAQAAADEAQADADKNAEAIAGLDTTYVSESEMTEFKTSNTTAIATAKTEAIAAAKTAGDAAYDAKGSAAAAQTAAVNAAKSAADATYQVKSSALSVGAADGAWTDLTKAAGYSATGTHSLVLKNGTIQWEAVKYAE